LFGVPNQHKLFHDKLVRKITGRKDGAS
jgi:hypothetical protein